FVPLPSNIPMPTPEVAKPQASEPRTYKGDLHKDLLDDDFALEYFKACAIEGALPVALREFREALLHAQASEPPDPFDAVKHEKLKTVPIESLVPQPESVSSATHDRSQEAYRIV